MTKKESSVFKGMAIIMMLIHHLFAEAAVYENFDIRLSVLNQETLQYLGALFKLCVAIFVFISAYGFSCSISSNDKKKLGDTKLIGRRTVKIILPFTFIYIISFIVGLITKTIFETYSRYWQCFLYYMIIDAFGLANAVGTPTLNSTWWYMSFAIILPILIYCIHRIDDKLGYVAAIIITALVPMFLNLPVTNSISWYILTATFGVLCAKYDLISKFKKLTSNIFISILAVVIATALIYVINNTRIAIGHYWLIDAVLVMLFLTYAILFSRIPGLSHVLDFLGKHSMNIFLIHSFIFYYYLKDFTFGLKYPALIFLFVLGSSLILSIAIELVKKLIKFDKLENLIIKKIGS